MNLNRYDAHMQYLYGQPEEHTMRNMVSVIDPPLKKLTYNDLEYGQMYRYTDYRDNIYIKTTDDGATLLNTGGHYTGVDKAKEITVFSEIRIKR